jgi:hypothetical protein
MAKKARTQQMKQERLEAKRRSKQIRYEQDESYEDIAPDNNHQESLVRSRSDLNRHTSSSSLDRFYGMPARLVSLDKNMNLELDQSTSTPIDLYKSSLYNIKIYILFTFDSR